MSKIKIITDAASDISSEDELKYGIRVIPFQVTLGDESYTTRVDMDNAQFYARMAQCDEIPKTAQVNPFQFQEIYLQEAQAGYTDLILVLINSEGSATYGNSLLAAEQFFEEHPEYRDRVHIHSFDGLGYSALYGAPVIEAARMAESGAGATAITAYLRDCLPQRQVYFGMYTLKYAAKSGRIPSAAAFLGDKLGLKPIMKIFDRAITTAAKCRGDAKLAQKVAEMTAESILPGTPYEVIYGSDESSREEMTKLLTEKLGYPPAAAYQIGAVIAANAGPKVAGAAFTRKPE
ncbi:MAG: DegV family protein [Oscillospiraceae bacterium]